MSDAEKGPFEFSIDTFAGMRGELVEYEGRYVVVLSGFDGDWDVEHLRHARGILTRAILDLVRRAEVKKEDERIRLIRSSEQHPISLIEPGGHHGTSS